MTLEEGLRTYLLSVDAITAIIDQKIFGVIRGQGLRELPELLITRSATRSQELFCGTDSLRQADIQIDCYAIDGVTCVNLAKAVRLTLNRYTGSMGDVFVDQVTVENEFIVTDSDPGIIRMVQLYNFWYVEDSQ